MMIIGTRLECRVSSTPTVVDDMGTPLLLFSVSEAAAPLDTPRFVAFIDSCAQRCQLAFYAGSGA
jgi:hypothetical protein